MTAKKTARPLKKPVKPPLKRAQPDSRLTFEQRSTDRLRLQLVAKPEAEPEAEADSAPQPGQLSDKELILRLVEVLKGL